jgi:chorismate mutase/prephenate dehydratase
MAARKKLSEHRKKIDEIDAQILKLLGRRGKEVQDIGKIKQKKGAVFHVPEREATLLKRLRRQNPGPYSDAAVEAVFREIMSASLALEAPLHVAFLGPEATFTHLAAIRRFGISAHFLPQGTLRQVFEEVANHRVDYGMVPIENSTEGVVTHTLDLFMEFTLQICGEIQIEISHNLLAKDGKISQIKRVFSHPHALAQCRNWLEKNLPHAKTQAVASTAKAAEMASKEKNSAAIASSYAANIYGLNVLRKHVEDHPNNFTRFLVIGHRTPAPTGHDKTSIMFSTKDEPGVLFKILKPLAESRINLTKIESRPLKKRTWEYVFFIDLDGHSDDRNVARALTQLAKVCSFVQILGSYPKEAGK